jgi:ribonuclease H2 subunit A
VQTPKKKGKGKGKRANEDEEKMSKKRKVDGVSEDADGEANDEPDDQEEVVEVEVRGSGYPSGWSRLQPLLTSDPKTQAYLRNSFHPVFGYPGIVRFSWATVKVIIDKDGAPCTWCVALLSNR